MQKNQQEILRLRQHLARVQANYPTPNPLIIEADEMNDETTNISIIKLA